MAWHDSKSEMGGWGSRMGFEPRFTSEAVGLDSSIRIRAKVDV